jgi:hypothetical protein
MKVSRIERVGDGVRVTLADGSTATYANAAQVPDDVAGLLSRMDAADGGDSDGQPQGDGDAARDAYRQRLEQASQQTGQPDPGQGLMGADAYRARLEAGWQERPAPKQINAHKHWPGV